MVDAWLDLSIPLLVTVAAAAYAASAILLNWVSHHSPIAARIGKLRGIVGPFFVSVSLFFGFFLTFLAADVWERKSQAAHIVRAERDALTALLALAAVNQQQAAKLNADVAEYAEAVVQNEWRQMRSQQSAPDAADRLDRLLASVASGADRYAPAVHSAMLQKALAVRDLRANRLSLSQDKAESLKWLSVLVLAFLTQIAIAAVHLESSIPQRAALMVFTLAAVFAICVVAAYERPFDGPISIVPDPLAELLTTTKASR